MDGKEIIQVYIKDKASEVAIPLKELVAFKSVELKAGEEVLLSLKIKPEQLAVFNEAFDQEIEA